MSYGINLHTVGGFACFTRPEMKVERDPQTFAEEFVIIGDEDTDHGVRIIFLDGVTEYHLDAGAGTYYRVHVQSGSEQLDPLVDVLLAVVGSAAVDRPGGGIDQLKITQRQGDNRHDKVPKRLSESQNFACRETRKESDRD